METSPITIAPLVMYAEGSIISVGCTGEDSFFNGLHMLSQTMFTQDLRRVILIYSFLCGTHFKQHFIFLSIQYKPKIRAPRYLVNITLARALSIHD